MPDHATKKAWDDVSPDISTEDFNHPYKLDVALIRLVGAIVREWGVHAFTVHSDYRSPSARDINLVLTGQTQSFSYHQTGQALDFRMSYYDGLNQRERLRVFYDDYLQLTSILEKLGESDRVGLGIYPNQNNPFFHLDTRGHRARWARLTPEGPSTDTLEDGLLWIKTRL